ncbi:Fe2+-dependent dioxygenase [Flavobacterium sp.]|jgi:PKHD-type hydroxylase|uniref:Fe2+-dependent dioxygenase n=1 Tax=Flavobacterium sp. TaxID=239 RepID=UPI0037C11D44
MLLFNIFDDTQVNNIRTAISKVSFTDGKLTAQGEAKLVKNNQQITHSSSKEAKQLPLNLERELVKNPTFRNYTHFRLFADTMINKYGPGETYGWHYDNHLIKAQRTDISFTLFLTDPKSYEGGELELKYQQSTKIVKGNPGQILIYPTGVLHRVNPVTKGERISMVGWIQSWVKNFEDREMLNLMQSQIQEIKGKIPAENTQKLRQALQYFFRSVSSS